MSISNDEAYRLIKQLAPLARNPVGGACLLYSPNMRPPMVMTAGDVLDVIRKSTEVEITEQEVDDFLDREGL